MNREPDAVVVSSLAVPFCVGTGSGNHRTHAPQLLGFNAFTVVLAALIVFFLSMNYALGPGWLGSQIGVPGTGTIREVSPSLPGTIDLNRPEYRL